jgi:hypothetical protein
MRHKLEELLAVSSVAAAFLAAVLALHSCGLITERLP